MVKDKKTVLSYFSANRRQNIFLSYMKKVIRFFNYGRIAKPLPLAWVIILLLASCTSANKNSPDNQLAVVSLPDPGEDFFLDITEFSGIHFRHSIGDHHLSNLVESVGGGAAFIDFDQDGFLDLYVVNGAHVKGLSEEGEELEFTPINQLFRNQGNGTFSDVTKKSRTGDAGYGMGVTVGDYDNDGYPDIYVSNYGPNSLYHNNGNGTFTEVSAKAGIAGNECSVGAVWLDYDNDGYIDLYVGNYINFDPEYNYYYAPDGFPGPMAYDGQPDRLYRNLGDGTFKEVTEEMGLFNPEGRAMGVGSADYNEDGWMDIYVANDHMVNYLYENVEGKMFREVGIQSGTAFNQVGEATISMAVDFADYNGDGTLDLFVSDDGYCSLFANQGDGVFSEMSYHAGIASASGQHVGWSTSFIDYDNDRDMDIFKVNGELKHLYGQEDQLFENNGTGSFTDVSVERGKHFQQERVSRGACFGDYDNDGDIDVFIVNLDDKGVLLRNDHGNRNNWLIVHLTGTKSNRDAIGTRVKLTAGGLTQVSQRKGGSGYLSQNDPRLHFGLGSVEKVDEIRIFWPSGTEQVIKDIDAGQILKIEEPD
jgi:enediyne biosynthesis protein E4